MTNLTLLCKKFPASPLVRSGIVLVLGLMVFPGLPAPGAGSAFPSLEAAGQGKPLVSTRECAVDFTSKTTGRDYRLMISAPYRMDASKTYPVVYIMDGYWYFRPAVDFNTEAGDRLQPAIIVGIGYPTEDYKEHCDRRMLDLSVPPDPAAKSTRKADPSDGDAFLRMLQDEVKPYVESHYPVDKSRQTLYGKSLGGLMVLRQLFRNPAAFQTYVAASPAMSWNDKAVLADEAAFSAQARAGKLRLKLLITSAELEQYRGADPEQLARAQRNRMVDNASELAARLKALDPANVIVDYTLFPGESHFSVSLACLGRGLAFALKPDVK